MRYINITPFATPPDLARSLRQAFKTSEVVLLTEGEDNTPICYALSPEAAQKALTESVTDAIQKRPRL